MVGLTRGATKNHIVRAALEAMAYHTADVLSLMEAESGIPLALLKVDGGASANNFLLQFQADILHAELLRPQCIETTALGAATLAGLAVGLYASTDEIAQNQQSDRIFIPTMAEEKRQRLLRNWKKAVSRARDWEALEN